MNRPPMIYGYFGSYQPSFGTVFRRDKGITVASSCFCQNCCYLIKRITTGLDGWAGEQVAYAYCFVSSRCEWRLITKHRTNSSMRKRDKRKPLPKPLTTTTVTTKTAEATGTAAVILRQWRGGGSGGERNFAPLSVGHLTLVLFRLKFCSFPESDLGTSLNDRLEHDCQDGRCTTLRPIHKV